jgi:hypothetical protein
MAAPVTAALAAAQAGGLGIGFRCGARALPRHAAPRARQPRAPARRTRARSAAAVAPAPRLRSARRPPSRAPSSPQRRRLPHPLLPGGHRHAVPRPGGDEAQLSRRRRLHRLHCFHVSARRRRARRGAGPRGASFLRAPGARAHLRTRPPSARRRCGPAGSPTAYCRCPRCAPRWTGWAASATPTATATAYWERRCGAGAMGS